jgi:hypothetical protein
MKHEVDVLVLYIMQIYIFIYEYIYMRYELFFFCFCVFHLFLIIELLHSFRHIVAVHFATSFFRHVCSTDTSYQDEINVVTDGIAITIFSKDTLHSLHHHHQGSVSVLHSISKAKNSHTPIPQQLGGRQ